jgi:hypothetical protein
MDEEAEIDYESEGDDADTGVDTEPEGYLAEPGTDEAEESQSVVDNLGVSEGSAAMSRGIYVDDEFSGQPIEAEAESAPDTVENRQLDKGAEQEV